MATALSGHAGKSHAHAKPWAWHPRAVIASAVGRGWLRRWRDASCRPGAAGPSAAAGNRNNRPNYNYSGVAADADSVTKVVAKCGIDRGQLGDLSRRRRVRHVKHTGHARSAAIGVWCPHDGKVPSISTDMPKWSNMAASSTVSLESSSQEVPDTRSMIPDPFPPPFPPGAAASPG